MSAASRLAYILAKYVEKAKDPEGSFTDLREVPSEDEQLSRFHYMLFLLSCQQGRVPYMELSTFLVEGPTYPVPLSRLRGAKISSAYFSWKRITAC